MFFIFCENGPSPDLSGRKVEKRELGGGRRPFCFETRKGSARCFATKEYDMVGMIMNMDLRPRNIWQTKMEISNATRGTAEGLKEDNNVKSRIKVN